MAKKDDIDDIPTSGKTEEEKNEKTEFDHSVPLDPRAEAMNRVVQQSAEAREESQREFEEQMGFEQDNDPMQAETEGDEMLADEDKAEGAPVEEIDKEVDKEEEIPENQDIEPDSTQKVKLKVNGVEREYTQEEAEALMQKGANADFLARQAAEAKRTYEEKTAQLEAEPTLPSEEDAEADAVDTQEALKEALEKVYDGDTEDAAEILSKVLSGGVKPNNAEELTPEKVVQIVQQRDDYLALKDSYNRFIDNEDYKHITSDEVLLDRVNTITEDLQKDPEFLKTNPTYDDYFNEAAKRTNDWVEKLTGKNPQPPSDKIDEKDRDDERIERKRQTPKPPTSRTQRRGTPPDKTYPAKSREQVISDMAKARGQTNFN